MQRSLSRAQDESQAQRDQLTKYEDMYSRFMALEQMPLDLERLPEPEKALCREILG